MTYNASLGIRSILITVGVALFFASLAAYLLYRTIHAHETILWVIYIVTVTGLSSLFLLTYLYRPTGYTVDEKSLIIRRPIKDVRIPMHEITDAYSVRSESMMGRERLGGNGGVFGFYGDFKNDFGIMTWYATRLGNYVMIETMHGGRIILTPDDTGLLREIRRFIHKQ